MAGSDRTCGYCGIRTNNPVVAKCIRPAILGGRTVYELILRNSFFCQTCSPVYTYKCAGKCGLTIRTYMGNRGGNSGIPVKSTKTALGTTRVCRICSPDCLWYCARCGEGNLENKDYMCFWCSRPAQKCGKCKKMLINRENQVQQSTHIINVNEFVAAAGEACTDCIYKVEHAAPGRINRVARTIGLEIEHMLPRGILKEAARRYVDFGIVKGDGSIHPPEGWSGWELCTKPAGGDAFIDQTGKIYKTLQEFDAMMDERCGLHTHVDVSKLPPDQVENVLRWWSELEPMFMALVASSRRNNQFCRPCYGREPRDPAWRGHRYRSLNQGSIAVHGTVEFRLHHGTMDGETVMNWGMLLASFVDTFSQVDWHKVDKEKLARFKTGGAREMVIFLLQQCKMPLRLRKYIVQAAKAHNRRMPFQKSFSVPMTFTGVASQPVPPVSAQTARDQLLNELVEQSPPAATAVLNRRDFDMMYRQVIASGSDPDVWRRREEERNV